MTQKHNNKKRGTQHNDTQHNGTKYCYAECLSRVSFMANVVNKPIVLCVVMLSVIMLSVVMQSLVASLYHTQQAPSFLILHLRVRQDPFIIR
jgi:hypothetical protein